jgi:lipoyl(octanoyl) transferase
MPLGTRWRLLVSAPADGATNMAVDHALFERAATADDAVLRVYGWLRPTLSLGMHERARLDPAAVAAQGVDVVRRPTGGRALLHHREVTYSVTAPTRGQSLNETFRAINALLLDALGELGVAATEAERRGRASAPDGAACFAEPNVGELVVGGRKLVGSAQRRDEHALLQHGSILLADDQALVASLRGSTEPVPPAATLRDALGRDVSPSEVHDALRAALARVSGAAPAAMHDDELQRTHGDALARLDRHYRDAAWTWRR